MAWNDEQTNWAYGVRLSGSQMNESIIFWFVCNTNEYIRSEFDGWRPCPLSGAYLIIWTTQFLHKQARISFAPTYTLDDSLLIELSSSTAHNYSEHASTYAS